ncbi:MAG: hypothetical protein QOD30_696, partial [Actinomycetota bacterium]|nr:hypothetical protein [Actinomycetota bacterium]
MLWGYRSRPLARVAVAVAALAILSAPASVLTAARHRANSHAGLAASGHRSSDESARREVGASGVQQSAAPAINETVIAPPPMEFDAPPAPPEAPPAALHAPSIAAQGGVWAVVIGIDDYPGRHSDLRASVADA